jgi:excisionase family DNA binding protein
LTYYLRFRKIEPDFLKSGSKQEMACILNLICESKTQTRNKTAMKNQSYFENFFKQIVQEAIIEVLPPLLKSASFTGLSKKYLTVSEAVQVSGLSERQIRYLIEKRELAFHQPGRKIAISSDSLLNYLESIRVTEVKK